MLCSILMFHIQLSTSIKSPDVFGTTWNHHSNQTLRLSLMAKKMDFEHFNIFGNNWNENHYETTKNLIAFLLLPNVFHVVNVHSSEESKVYFPIIGQNSAK